MYDVYAVESNTKLKWKVQFFSHNRIFHICIQHTYTYKRNHGSIHIGNSSGCRFWDFIIVSVPWELRSIKMLAIACAGHNGMMMKYTVCTDMYIIKQIHICNGSTVTTSSMFTQIIIFIIIILIIFPICHWFVWFLVSHLNIRRTLPTTLKNLFHRIIYMHTEILFIYIICYEPA